MIRLAALASLIPFMCVPLPVAEAEPPQVVELSPGKGPIEPATFGAELVRMSPRPTHKRFGVTEPIRLVTNATKPTITIDWPAMEKVCPGSGYWDFYRQLAQRQRQNILPGAVSAQDIRQKPSRVGATIDRADGFALKDGDTVVFLGDSITAARTYGKIIENYTLLRFPDRKVSFVNAVWGGDTAAGGLIRLERDVFIHKPTVVTVAYGVNDIGWGAKADAAHKQAYLDGVRGIVQACTKRGVRVFICSAAATAENPTTAEDGFLQKMCDEGMALSRSLGGRAIDVQRTMRGIQKKILATNQQVRDKTKHDTLHTADGIHLNELGQLSMAYAILKGLEAPADVSTVAIDFKERKLLHANGCKVSNLVLTDAAVEFTRLDEGLPFNYGVFPDLRRDAGSTPVLKKYAISQHPPD